MSSASRSWWWRGVQVLIPETGKVDEWIGDVDESSGLFFVGAWLVILGGILGLVALVGFYDALREASPAMFVAPGAGVTLLPRWLGWLGLVVGAFALLGLLGPASSVAEGLTFPGFVGFFVWMAAMGITLLRRRNRLGTVPL